jgi:hypothetical protein
LWAEYSHTVGLGIDDRHELRHLGDLGEIDALAEIVIGCDRERAELGKPPRHILDVFVQPENLHRHQDDRRVGRVGGAGEVDRHLAVGHLDLGVADREPAGIGLDGVGTHRSRRERVAGGSCG